MEENINNLQMKIYIYIYIYIYIMQPNRNK